MCSFAVQWYFSVQLGMVAGSAPCNWGLAEYNWGLAECKWGLAEKFSKLFSPKADSGRGSTNIFQPIRHSSRATPSFGGGQWGSWGQCGVAGGSN